MVKKEDKEKGIVESFLGGMPMFGDFFKELAKTEVFKEKFKEINEKIEENLRKGEKKLWSVESNISVKPLTTGTKKDACEIFIGEDYMYGKKANALKLAVKVPSESVILDIKNKKLLISSNSFKKEIELPDYYKNIRKKKYKKGILVVEITK